MAIKEINPNFIPNHELEGIRERGIKRAERRVEEREHLRLEIEGRKLLGGMHEAVFKLLLGYEEGQEAGLLVPLTKDRISALKAGIDGADKLMRKVLPDLKQIELSEGDGTGEGRILDSVELQNRMRIYLEAIQTRGDNVVPFRPEEEVAVEGELVDDSMDFLK